MLNELKQLGLTEYEARVYKTLLECGSLKGGEISKKSKVPHGKTYESLFSLESKGFVSVTPIKPKLFTAFKPEIAVNNLLSSKVNQYKEIQNQISEKLKESKKTKKDKTVEKVQVTTGLKKALSISQYLFESSNKIMRHMFTYEVLAHSRYKSMRDAVERGVEVRVLATKKTPETLKLMKEDIKDGIKVRYYPVEEIRMDVSDNDQSMLLFLNPKDRRDRMILFFEHGYFSKLLSGFFDEIWNKAEIIK